MQNRMAVLLCNLKPAKMRGVVSQAMVMCASSPDKVEILDPPSGAVPGDRVTFQGFPGTVTLVTLIYLHKRICWPIRIEDFILKLFPDKQALGITRWLPVIVTDFSLKRFPRLVSTKWLCVWELKGVAEPFHCQKQHGGLSIHSYEETNHNLFLDPTESSH